jgi:hypothetical protein
LQATLLLQRRTTGNGTCPNTEDGSSGSGKVYNSSQAAALPSKNQPLHENEAVPSMTSEPTEESVTTQHQPVVVEANSPTTYSGFVTPTPLSHPPGKVLFFLDGGRIDMGSVRHYAKEYGFETLCLINLHNRMYDDYKKYDYFCAVNNFNPGDVIKDLVSENALGLCPLPQGGDAVICPDEHCLPAAYGISERYNIYPASKNGNFKPLNKLEQRQCLSRNDLEDQQPKYRELNINSDKSIQAVMQQVGLPAVLKTLEGVASIGVYIAKTQSEFEEAVGAARSLVADKLPLGGLDCAKPDGASSIFVLEEYISHERGKEYSLEGSVFDGKVTIYAIGEKMMLKDLDGKIQQGGQINLPLRSPEAQIISCSTPVWIDAFGYRNGLFNLDCMIMDGNAKLLEANYRCGGTNFLYEAAYGYSTEEALVANAAGREFCPNQVPTTDEGLGYLPRPFLNSQKTTLPVPGSIEFLPLKGREGRGGQQYVLVRAESAEYVKSIIEANLAPGFVVDKTIVPPLGPSLQEDVAEQPTPILTSNRGVQTEDPVPLPVTDSQPLIPGRSVITASTDDRHGAVLPLLPTTTDNPSSLVPQGTDARTSVLGNTQPARSGWETRVRRRLSNLLNCLPCNKRQTLQGSSVARETLAPHTPPASQTDHGLPEQAHVTGGDWGMLGNLGGLQDERVLGELGVMQVDQNRSASRVSASKVREPSRVS